MSFISKRQLTTIQIAYREVQRNSDGMLDDGQWRMTLRNIGGVRPDATGHVSAKQLDQRGFERMMHFLEDHGYQEAGRSPTHWRSRPGVRDDRASTRQLHEITTLATMAAGAVSLAGLVRRLTKDKCDRPEQLTGA